MGQTVKLEGGINNLGEILRGVNTQKYLLVCGGSFSYLGISDSLEKLNIPHVKFTGFKPNPLYEDVCNGVRVFNDEQCDAIVAIGGGSALDVAKCIKLFCKMEPGKNYLTQQYTDTGVPLIAVPTTAGTGSESTKHAVIYYQGEKQSVSHDSIVPNYAILEPSLLKPLPLYQKKCTLLDALCQGIESWWSVNSTEQSIRYAKLAVETIVKYMDDYLETASDEAMAQIMLASNYAGRAINLTQTTAPHAMSYKLTTLYGLPHGHAVALCLPLVWRYMLEHTGDCIDPRGSAYLKSVFKEIPIDPQWFEQHLKKLGMGYPQAGDREAELSVLTRSVNSERLKNNPVALNGAALRGIYERILQ